MKLSARAQQALEILADGGVFVWRRESRFLRGSVWRWRLLNFERNPVLFQTNKSFHELDAAGYLSRNESHARLNTDRYARRSQSIF